MKRYKVFSKKYRMLASCITIAFALYFVSTIDAKAAEEFHVTTEQALIDASAQANAGDVIIVDADIQLTKQLNVNKNITLKGSEKYTLTQTSSSTDIRHIYTTTAMTIENLVFDGQNVNGGVKSGEALTINNCEFKNNIATDTDGGAVYASGELDIEGSQFENNVANSDGGAVYATEGATVTDSAFNNNRLTNNFSSSGGALSISGDAIISDATFTDNTASSEYGLGGAVSTTQGNIQISNSVFKNNQAAQGGALYVKGSNAANTMSVDNSNFEGNTSGTGGAVSAFFGGTFSNCEFRDNTSTAVSSGLGGGAINANSGPVITENSLYENNSAYAEGGAISTFETVTATQSIFTGNDSTDPNLSYGNGGAIFSYETMVVDQCVFTDNSATGLGGATYAHADSTYTNSTYHDNIAAEAGALYQCLSSGVITNTTFYGNEGTIRHGAVSTSGAGDYDIINSTFLNNSSVGDANHMNFYGSIVDEVPEAPAFDTFTNCIGYLGTENQVFSQTELLNYDTKIPVGLGTGTETLKLGYVPIQPNGLADNQITVSESTWAPATDSLGSTRGTVSSDIGSFEEIGQLKTEIVSGNHQNATITTAFTEPLTIRSFYQSAIQPLEIPLADKTFTVVAPSEGASAMLSAQTVTTDVTGKASVDAMANGTLGDYQVVFTDNEDSTQSLAFSLANVPVVIDPVDPAGPVDPVTPVPVVSKPTMISETKQPIAETSDENSYQLFMIMTIVSGIVLIGCRKLSRKA